MKVKIFSTLRQFTDQKEIVLPVEQGSTILDVLRNLTVEYPKLREQIFDEDHNLKNSIIVLINGRNIAFLDNVNTFIQESDQVAIFPLVGGG